MIFSIAPLPVQSAQGSRGTLVWRLLLFYSRKARNDLPTGTGPGRIARTGGRILSIILRVLWLCASCDRHANDHLQREGFANN